MKIGILGDTHFGMRNDSTIFIEYGEKFYKEIFFPYLRENGIKTLIQLGDVFDRRKYCNFYSLKKTKEVFFDRLYHYGIDTYLLVGNHDTYYKNTNSVNSLDLLLQEYPNLHIIENPTTIAIDGVSLCMVPWVCSDNVEVFTKEVEDTKADICFGHFEIAGFAMYKDMTNVDGLDRKIFRKFDTVYSGHYHYRSHQDNIYYLGTPMQMTWQDYGDKKGFHVLDLETRDLEFIPNPHEIFIRSIYDDKKTSVSEIGKQDMSIYTNKYVKVIVVNKTNPYAANPADVTVVEDFSDVTEGIEAEMIDQSEDTLTIINKVVDNLEMDLSKDRLKSMMKELYVEALNTEQA